jgi:hypothetical protein
MDNRTQDTVGAADIERHSRRRRADCTCSVKTFFLLLREDGEDHPLASVGFNARKRGARSRGTRDRLEYLLAGAGRSDCRYRWTL